MRSFSVNKWLLRNGFASITSASLISNPKGLFCDVCLT